LSWGFFLLVIVGLLGGWRWFVAGVVLVGLALSLWHRSWTATAGANAAIIVAMTMVYCPDWMGGLGGTLLVIGALANPIAKEMSIPSLRAKYLPNGGADILKSGPFDGYLAFGTAWLAAFGLMNLPTWSFAIVAGVPFAVAAVAAAGRIIRGYRNVVPKQLGAAVKEHAPRWAIHFTGAPEEVFQLEMWIPYLELTKEPYVIIIREEECFDAVAKVTDAPVLLAQNLRGIEMAIPESLRTIFYVNNNARNVNAVHFTGLTHVSLGHGDSEKPSSFRKSFGMFDQIFVAGQAGIDRFARNGVDIAAEKFRIVGRPQLTMLESIKDQGPRTGPPVVLYAPTWRGGVGEMDFGSLPMGEEIVKALLELGAIVAFRPHPLSLRDAQTRVYIKRIDALLTGELNFPSADCMSLPALECMNISTMMISDMSSVVSDYLYTLKPFGITNANGLSLDELTKILPVAAAGTLIPSGADLKPTLDQMLRTDTLAAERARMRDYYLGNFPPEHYTEAFVSAAKAAMGCDS
jgi:hypothetical protein